jgi:RHS repeat-associated protein
VALSATSAAATSQQLYGPYGGLRYATGSMPMAKGYTGQYADVASSGLDYYNARYYDPLVGQFASADSTADGLNRYAYAKGNPRDGHRSDRSSGVQWRGGLRGRRWRRRRQTASPTGRRWRRTWRVWR